MNDNQGSSSGLPPFIVKTYEMIDDHSTNAIVSWSQSNKSFIVWNPPEFCGELLPKFFKHNNFSSFIRQLNTYGFRKIDHELWEFANEDFIKGQPHLLKNIHRRKPVHSHSIQNLSNNGQQILSSPLTESEKHIYKEKINNLRYEKESLSILFPKHQQEEKQIETKARELTERLKLAGKKQKEILCYMGDNFSKKVGDTNDRKRRLSCENGNNQICSFDVKIREGVKVDAILGLDNELVDQLEASLVLWEGVIKEVEDEIDVKSEAVVVGGGGEVGGDGVTVGVNDVFWEQFLTENPGGGGGDREKESKGLDQYGKFWWNVRSVNNFVNQLGQT